MMINNDYINHEVKDITSNINEFINLTTQIGINTPEDAELVCRWYNLKILLEKKGVITSK